MNQRSNNQTDNRTGNRIKKRIDIFASDVSGVCLMALLVAGCSAVNSPTTTPSDRAGIESTVSVEKISPIAAKPGEVVQVTGKDFSKGTSLKAQFNLTDGSSKDVELTVASPTSASFVMPEGVGLGQTSLNLVQGVRQVASFKFVANTAENGLPILIADPATICRDTEYVDKNGEIQTGGTKYCIPGVCTSDGQKDCMATGDYFAGKACTANGSGCYLPTYAQTTQPLKAISYDDINNAKGYLRTTTILGGVTGTLADCVANGSGCYLRNYSETAGTGQSLLKAADIMNLTAGNIKDTVVINGVTGNYPSSNFPLASNTATADLTNTFFNTKITSASNFEYFDSAGVAYIHAGDANIVVSKIASNVSIFGTQGKLTTPDPWDLRAGTTVVATTGTVTGKLKVNCRNRVSTSSPTLYNYDGIIGSIGQAFQTGGSVRDIWDTIDDYNDAQVGVPGGVVTAWGNNTDCYGVEATAGDDNVWKDVTTTNGTAASTCTATPANCTMQDKITGISWSKLQTSAAWNTAWNTCQTTLNASGGYNGQTGWRLPTQKELMEAYTHGIRSAASTNWMTEANMNNWFWSGSSVSYSTGNAWYVNLANGHAVNFGKNYPDQVVCVRGV